MRTLVLIPAVLAIAGCSGADAELIGEWEFDPATYQLIQKFHRISPEEQKHWIDTAHINLTFTENTIAWDQSLPGWGERAASATYEVIDVDGARVTIEAKFDDAAKKKRYVFTIADGRLRFGLGGRSIILKRKITESS